MIEPLSGEPTAYYPPGYRWFVGIVTWLGIPLSDSVVTLVALAQAVLGAMSVVLGAIVGRCVPQACWERPPSFGVEAASTCSSWAQP